MIIPWKRIRDGLFYLVFFLGVAYVLWFVVLGAVGIFFSDELRSKHEWSVLQAVSASHELKSDGIAVFRYEDYCVAGIPGKHGSVWILLNAKNPPLYKQIPADGTYKITSADVEYLAHECEGINPLVIEQMKSH